MHRGIFNRRHRVERRHPKVLRGGQVAEQLRGSLLRLDKHLAQRGGRDDDLCILLLQREKEMVEPFFAVPHGLPGGRIIGRRCILVDDVDQDGGVERDDHCRSPSSRRCSIRNRTGSGTSFHLLPPILRILRTTSVRGSSPRGSKSVILKLFSSQVSSSPRNHVPVPCTRTMGPRRYWAIRRAISGVA